MNARTAWWIVEWKVVSWYERLGRPPRCLGVTRADLDTPRGVIVEWLDRRAARHHRFAVGLLALAAAMLTAAGLAAARSWGAASPQLDDTATLVQGLVGWAIAPAVIAAGLHWDASGRSLDRFLDVGTASVTRSVALALAGFGSIALLGGALGAVRPGEAPVSPGALLLVAPAAIATALWLSVVARRAARTPVAMCGRRVILAGPVGASVVRTPWRLDRTARWCLALTAIATGTVAAATLAAAAAFDHRTATDVSRGIAVLPPMVLHSLAFSVTWWYRLSRSFRSVTAQTVLLGADPSGRWRWRYRGALALIVGGASLSSMGHPRVEGRIGQLVGLDVATFATGLMLVSAGCLLGMWAIRHATTVHHLITQASREPARPEPRIDIDPETTSAITHAAATAGVTVEEEMW